MKLHEQRGCQKSIWSVFRCLPVNGSNFLTCKHDETTLYEPCINGTESQQSWLYQDVATLAGQQYLLSFDFSATGDPMELEVVFDGVVVFDLTGLGSQSSYTSYSTNVTASGTATRLAFLGRQDPRYNALDNIALFENSVISDAPEPSAWMLGFGGVLAICGFRRR